MPYLKNVLVAASLCAAIVSSQAAQAEKVLSGEVCSSQVHKLSTQIEWYNHLSKAEDAARQQGKLILWIHMVGKIDGAT